MLLLTATALLLGSPQPVPCGGSLQAALADRDVQLEAGCAYEGDLSVSASVVIRGAPGAKIVGRIQVRAQGSLTLSQVELRAEVVGLVVHEGASARLDGVVVEARDGLHAQSCNVLHLSHSVIRAREAAMWVEGCKSLRLSESTLDGGETALVLRDHGGPTFINASTLRARPTSHARAGSYIQSRHPVEISDSRLEFFVAAPDRAVLQLDAPGQLMFNEVVGLSLGLRLGQKVRLLSNRFLGMSRRVEAPEEPLAGALSARTVPRGWYGSR